MYEYSLDLIFLKDTSINHGLITLKSIDFGPQINRYNQNVRRICLKLSFFIHDDELLKSYFMNSKYLDIAKTPLVNNSNLPQRAKINLHELAR